MPSHVLDSITESLRREFEESGKQAAAQARAELLQTLNQLLRRFRTYQTENDWVQTTLDAAREFAGETAVFAVVNDMLQLRGQTPAAGWPVELSFPIASANAFSSAIELKDPVTALRTATEVSAFLCNGRSSERAHVLPILNGTRVSAVLFASEAGCDMNALELVAGLASSVLERKANNALHSQISAAPALIKTELISDEPVSHDSAKLPAWGELPSEQRQAHVRAQRFARVALAEIQLARPEACRAGREQGDLYLFLKREIDRARENYRKQFMTVPSMVDYLHLELLQVVAEGDEQKLGVDYPGRLR